MGHTSAWIIWSRNNSRNQTVTHRPLKIFKTHSERICKIKIIFMIILRHLFHCVDNCARGTKSLWIKLLAPHWETKAGANCTGSCCIFYFYMLTVKEMPVSVKNVFEAVNTNFIKSWVCNICISKNTPCDTKGSMHKTLPLYTLAWWLPWIWKSTYTIELWMNQLMFFPRWMPFLLQRRLTN